MHTSEVLDVFTSLPQSGQANNNLTSPPATSADERTRIAKSSAESTPTKKRQPAPQEMKYKSIRAAPSGGHIWRDLSGDLKSLEEVKAVMEGPGERG